MRLEELLLSRKYAGKTFTFIDDAGEWSYSDLCEKVLSLSTSLKCHGVGYLDRVAIICENGALFLVAVLGSLMAGAIAVPIDPQVPRAQALEMVKQTGAKYICISGSRPEKNYSSECMGFQDEKRILLYETAGDWNAKSTCGELTDEFIGSDEDPAFILFSSGTSGAPKGIVLTHKAVSTNVDAIINYMQPTHKDMFYIAKTMVHSSTLTGEIFVALRVGAKIAAKNPVVSPITILKRIESLKPSIICVNPTILKLLLKAASHDVNLTSVRMLYTSGAVAEKELLIGAEHLFPSAMVLNGYGLTEAGPRVSAQCAEDSRRKYGSVGKPVQGVEICIKNDKGVCCDAGEVGVIFVKTPSLMLGYWNDKKATDEKIQDGWLNTGDLGFMDTDGELFIIGRSDDMIIRGGHNIDPAEIENVVRKIPGISDCIAFGIPDPLHGSRIICAFVKDNNYNITRQDIFAHCAMLLAPYQCPHEICEWSAMPVTSGGKISRKLAAEYYSNLRNNKKISEGENS